MEVIRFDAVIVGCGIAGATAAFELAKRGTKVALIASSANTWDLNSMQAQGGIVYLDEKEDEDALVRDIIDAGDGASDIAVVREFARIGPPLVKEFLIDELHILFSEGRIKETAHSKSRILFAHDHTGAAIMTTLLQRVSLHPQIFFKSDEHAFKLLATEEQCYGVYTFSRGRLFLYLAPHIILATGGVGDLYLRTSNSPEAKGDGLALAHPLGVEYLDLQYVQFHPTAFYNPNGRCFLLSETLRGEGAYLLNAKKRRFLSKRHPQAELAPCDALARLLHEEMVCAKVDHLWLKMHHQDPEKIKRRFPTLYQRCLAQGYDLTKTPVPIVPCAHYLCGGIRAALDGTTKIPGLFAIGEVAGTGLHGANRLASTSLLEGLLMGKLCAEKIAVQKWPVLPTDQPLPHLGTEHAPVEMLKQDFEVLKGIMWHAFGLIRYPEEMRLALAKLSLMQMRWSHLALDSPSAIRFKNGLIAAQLLAEAALAAPTSRGCHFLKTGLNSGASVRGISSVG